MRSILLSSLILSMGVFWTCSEPGGLDAVAGIQGTVEFEKAWPDSIVGAVLVVFDIDLDLDSLESPAYSVMDHFVSFSAPLEPTIGSVDYFIQLKEGDYLVMIIGLLIDPALLLTNEDLFGNIQEYIVTPENSAPRGIRIYKQMINEQTTWSVGF